MHLNELLPAKQSHCRKSVVAVFDNKDVWWSMLVQRSKLDGDNDIVRHLSYCRFEHIAPKRFQDNVKNALFLETHPATTDVCLSWP